MMGNPIGDGSDPLSMYGDGNIQSAAAFGYLQAENQGLQAQVQKLQCLVESLQKQLSLKDLLVEELTGEGNANEIENSAMLHMPDSIEQMMDTLLSNP